jgi:hypothetical protein
MGWVKKARGEVSALNCKKRDEEKRYYILCNLHSEEDVYHFVAICPILVEYRRLGSSLLNPELFLSFMQGATT